MTNIFENVVRRLEFAQRGQAYLLVMIFMLVGTMIATPLLTFMSSGLNNTLKYQNRTQELYAANAGINEAIWNLKSGNITMVAGETLSPLPLIVNDNNERPNKKPTTVSIFCMDKNKTGGIYKITSTASSSSTSNTTIETWVETRPLLMDYGLISSSIVKFKPGTSVNGSVAGIPYLNNGQMSEDDYSDFISGRVDDPFPPDDWPFDLVEGYYWNDNVSGTIIGPNINVGVAGKTIGPGYSEGDLVFDGDDGTLKLNGTIYVKGDLDLASNKRYTLDLNYQTIYVEGNISTPPSSPNQEGKPTITGSGCIIAEGDIDFFPNMSTEAGEYVFVMSTKGTVHFQPSGNFTGTVAGNVQVDAWPGSQYTYISPPAILNFPGLDEEGMRSAVHILTWNVSPPFATANSDLYISTSTLPVGLAGTSYSANISASGGTGNYVYSVFSGSLPDDLSMTTVGTKGVISGNLTSISDGLHAFVAKVEDTETHKVALRSFLISVSPSSTPHILSVTTGIADNIGNSTATISGRLDDIGTNSDVMLRFEYGTIEPLNLTAIGNPQTAYSSSTNFSANLLGLLPNTTYYYRAIAIGDDETKAGEVRSFTTTEPTPTPPGVASIEVKCVYKKGTYTFTVTGWVTSMGTADTAHAFIAMSKGSIEVPPDNSANWIEANGSPITKLNHNEFTLEYTSTQIGTYNFRAKAVGNNNAGTTYGANLSLTVPPPP